MGRQFSEFHLPLLRTASVAHAFAGGPPADRHSFAYSTCMRSAMAGLLPSKPADLIRRFRDALFNPTALYRTAIARESLRRVGKYSERICPPSFKNAENVVENSN